MAVIFVFNLLIGSNYLFIAHKPATASLMDVLPPWPVYIIFIEIIGVVVSLLLYAPFFWSDLRKKQRWMRLIYNIYESIDKYYGP